jgi:NAD-dependent deacetylase
MEQMGILTKIITQNVDSLHQEAGVSEVIEVHGNIFRMRCLSCGAKKQLKRKEFIRDIRDKLVNLKSFTFASLTSMAPACENCSFMMRPDVVMFGEAVQQLPRASKAAKECDAMMVLGTSGAVYPAAYFPIEAKHNGSKIIVINPTENAFTEVSDVYIQMKAGKALPLIVEQIKKSAS